MNNKQRAKHLFHEGFSFAKIGRTLGISRQRAHQLVTGYKSFAKRNFSFKHLEFLALGNRCKMCGKSAEDMHHKDGNSNNNTFANLVPLCKQCHREIHKLL